MRILVLLQPSNKHGTKMGYTKLRKHLHDDGFLMIAPELYMRVISNRKAVRKHLERMKPHVPPTGRVTMLTLTEKQWGKRRYLTGEPSYQEQVIGCNCSIML